MNKDEKNSALKKADEFVDNLDSLKKESDKLGNRKTQPEPQQSAPSSMNDFEVNSDPIKRKTLFDWKGILLFFMFMLIVCLSMTLLQNKQAYEFKNYEVVSDEAILDYINTEHPQTSVKKIVVTIDSAEYTDGLLGLTYTVQNDNENIIRFLTSSFRMTIGDRVITPVLAGTINENDVNTAKGVQPGESIKVKIHYDIEPSVLSGEAILLKGVFITSIGTYDIQYQMPEL